MLLRNKRAVVRVKVNPVLNSNDRKKFSAFVALLVQIDKRISTSCKTTNKAKLRKAKDALLGQYKKGSQQRRALFNLNIVILIKTKSLSNAARFFA
jgi:hypothetical protein